MNREILSYIISNIGLLRFGVSLIFGVQLTLLFSGLNTTKKEKQISWIMCTFFLLIQTGAWWILGLELTSKLYPLLVHLPIALILIFYFKQNILISFTCILSGYLCCQAPRWIGFLASALFRNDFFDHLFYILAAILIYYFYKYYVANSVLQLMERTKKSCLFLAGVPLFYYLFDYVTTIYTDLLYQGTQWAVQFMPSAVSIFYFVFVIAYYSEIQKQSLAQRELDMLDMQLKQAQIEFASLRQMQESAMTYRHDMRHHIGLLQTLLYDDKIKALGEYLSQLQIDMDKITPVRYCENETVNLILSSFYSKAVKKDITMEIHARLPETIPFTDTELCSLISNALENAIMATEQILSTQERIISLRMYSKNTKLCIDIRNTYHLPPLILNGIPSSSKHGHGFGTKSMAHIIDKHGGVYQFTTKDQWFIFQATA